MVNYMISYRTSRRDRKTLLSWISASVLHFIISIWVNIYHYCSRNSILLGQATPITKCKDSTKFVKRIFNLNLQNDAYLTKPSSLWSVTGNKFTDTQWSKGKKIDTIISFRRLILMKFKHHRKKKLKFVISWTNQSCSPGKFENLPFLILATPKKSSWNAILNFERAFWFFISSLSGWKVEKKCTRLKLKGSKNK